MKLLILAVVFMIAGTVVGMQPVPQVSSDPYVQLEATRWAVFPAAILFLLGVFAFLMWGIADLPYSPADTEL
jgi:hypothetical protein